jgi:disulfide bond formation protein DsbB
MNNDIKQQHLFLLALSISALIFAYFVEYIMGVAVCPLCIYARFPYLIMIALIIVSSNSENSARYNKYLVLTIFSAIILGIYHSGIERGIFTMSSFCKPLVNLSLDLSVEAFKQMLYSNSQMALCNQPSFVFFKLSLAEWNLIFNFFLAILVLRSSLLQKK